MYGWSSFGRNHWKHEDRRWGLWRERWSNGQSMCCGVRSIGINFFGFYHAQSFCNAVILCIPIHIVVTATRERQHTAPLPSLTPLQWFAVVLWVVSFGLENVADFQLAAFKDRTRKESTPSVMDSGLWRFSRHPNYFFELMIWVSYSLFAVEFVSLSVSLSVWWQLLGVLGVPCVAYIFLVHFTGIWMAEQASQRHRGAAYRKYMQRTSPFWPRPPRHLPCTQ